jgi:hypothetical protein
VLLTANELTAILFEYRDSGGTLVVSWNLADVQAGFIGLFQYDVATNELTIQGFVDFVAPFGNGDELDLFPPPDAVAWNINSGSLDDCFRIPANCDTTVSAIIATPTPTPGGTPTPVPTSGPSSVPTTSRPVQLFVFAMLLLLGVGSLGWARAGRD